MNNRIKNIQSNPKNKGDFIIRKNQPSFPHGALSNIIGPNLILEFVGGYVSQNSREVFSSIVINKGIAIDIKERLDEYLEHLSNYSDDDYY